jgi:hypothetical protein
MDRNVEDRIHRLHQHYMGIMDDMVAGVAERMRQRRAQATASADPTPIRPDLGYNPRPISPETGARDYRAVVGSGQYQATRVRLSDQLQRGNFNPSHR